MIEILKASAGSGKTHQLAKEYIRLLLTDKDRYAYRHILAVTFTNKATDEMKSRILSELHTLATQPLKSHYRDDFIGLFPDEKSLSDTANTILSNILHDYSAFAISTIDKFFQQTLKAFSRELGQFAAYQVELDRDALISECVGRVLDSLTTGKEDEKKLAWLTDNAIDGLENGKGFYLENSLTDIAKRLRSESHRSKAEEAGLDSEHLYDADKVKALSKGCKDIVAAFVDKLDAAVKAVDAAFEEAGMSASDTNYGFIEKECARNRGIKADRSRHIDISAPGKRFLDNYYDTEKWYGKAKAKLAASVTERMRSAVDNLAEVFEKDYVVYRTAVLLRDQVYGFGLANDINKEFREMLKEKNVLGLDDSNTILKGIIDGTDAPFIYEKMGVRFEHFLLDEFQDTSRIQWDNFKPLLENSVSQNFYNLVVGDVKQSIYRWRGSDWNLLDSEIARDFEVKNTPLDENWRSSREIVEFNNDFFREAAETLDMKYCGAPGPISRIYSDVQQKWVPKKDVSGGVEVTFCDGEEKLQDDVVLDYVREALGQGFRYSEIGILTRGRGEGSQIAAYLIANGIPVVTDDSLKILSSVTVRRLLSLLSSIDNPEDQMNLYLARQLDVTIPSEYHSLSDLCEELLRMLRDSDPATFEAETLYVQSFMDKVQDFRNKEQDGLHAFLESMADDNSSISSPSVGDSVRVMTIHKSKGLAFPYVIVPYIDSIGLFKSERTWCRPSVEGTALDGVAQGIYDVVLSQKSEDTLFSEDYRDELLRQYVDNINIAYVAFTRAKYQLRIVGQIDPEWEKKAQTKPSHEVSDFAQILWHYVRTHELVAHESVGRKVEDEEGDYMALPGSYCSWPLDGRLSFSKDSSDFFNEGGEAGAAASKRIRGLVLHDILSKVISPGDLPAAVAQAVENGSLSADEAAHAQQLLTAAIASVSSRGWFPEDSSKVWNETALISEDGSPLRPDRVVENPDGSLSVIDYKFGAPKRSHRRQVEGYADTFRKMGYAEVSTYLWYVESGNIL
ncbi:MAG: UvrD-helicase domain-containing protein [Bacteroidales bacterium]|nr:UvrD-helicase domain-containing protein [Bacteroidales bacterium]